MIRLINLAQTLDALTGVLGNEIVLRGETSGFEIRIPLSAEALAQVSRLVQLESEGVPGMQEPEPAAPVPDSRQYIQPTSAEDLGRVQEYVEVGGYEREQSFGDDDDDASELAAIGEI